jgi:hypothetical protein
MQYPKEVYDARREKLMAELRRSGGGVLLVPARHGVSEGFTFRQLDDFLYFSGLELPDSMLVFDANEGRVHLFAPSHDARYEDAGRPNDFPGRLLGADPDLMRESGFENVAAGVRTSSRIGRSSTSRVRTARREFLATLTVSHTTSVPRCKRLHSLLSNRAACAFLAVVPANRASCSRLRARPYAYRMSRPTPALSRNHRPEATFATSTCFRAPMDRASTKGDTA